MNDPFDLQRFVDAQLPVMARVDEELRGGRKRTHWMWFVFPQLTGLGSSAMAQRYAISSLEEARAYLRHPVLGPRLRTCCERVLEIPEANLHDIFGQPDDRKFRSCVTLFQAAAPDEALFQRCLDRFCDGKADPATLGLLAGH